MNIRHKTCISSRWVSGYSGSKSSIGERPNDKISNISPEDFLDRRISYFFNTVFQSYANQTNKNFSYCILGSEYGINTYKNKLDKIKKAFNSIGIECFYSYDNLHIQPEVIEYLSSDGTENTLMFRPHMDNDDILPKNYIDEIIRDGEFVYIDILKCWNRSPIPISLSYNRKARPHYYNGKLFSYNIIKDREKIEFIPPNEMILPNYTILYTEENLNNKFSLNHTLLHKHTFPFFTNITPPAISYHESSISRFKYNSTAKKIVENKELYDYYSLPYPF